MVAPAADTRMSHLAYVVAAVNLGGVIVLLVMYIVEIPRGAPYIFGSSSDLAGGIYNLLVVSLILHFGRSAAISGTGRLGLWLVVVASITGAISAFLLVLKTLPLGISTAISVTVVLIQGAWLLWVCSRYLAISDVPRSLSRLGELIGAIAASSAWIAWPFWYFRLGRYRRARRSRGTRPRSGCPRRRRSSPGPARRV